MHPLHDLLLSEIKKRSGKPTAHTFLENYLGNSHYRYAIANPELRKIAREWMTHQKELPTAEFKAVLTSLFKGDSFTEKIIGGFLLNYARGPHRAIKPVVVDRWLNYLEGWAEIDTLCTGEFSKSEIPKNWKEWKPVLIKLARNKSIGKRRASLVLFCSVFANKTDDDIQQTALANIDLLKSEKDVLITKAISWLLRSMIRHNRKVVATYLKDNSSTLPAIAVRETRVKLATGRKN